MLYRPLGRTDIRVSALALGSMTWGEQNSEAEAFEQIRRAQAAGINFIDTAEMYPVPPKAESCGATETIIGNYFRRHGGREQWIIASKAAAPGNGITHIRGGRPHHDRANLIAAVEGSLRRLQTDCIDLYQLHWPDRATNFFGQLGYRHDPDAHFTPIEESLEVLDELVRSGKIRHVGLSNETPWGLHRFLQLAETRGWPRPVSIQNPYNLLNRSFEVGLAEMAIREDVGLLAYSPLAFGLLSGKYEDGARPPQGRLTLFERFQRYNNPRARQVASACVRLAREHGLDPAQMALAWVTGQPFVTSNIIGATTLEQLERNIASLNLQLDASLLEAIEALQIAQPNPAP